MNYVIAICLAYMLALIVTFIVRLATSSRKERLQYVKNFKRGKFVLIYIAMIPLYFLAHRNNGASVEGALWQSISLCFDTVALKYPFNTTSSLMGANLFYRITVDFGYALVTLNAVMFTISLLGQIVLNALSLTITRCFRKRVVAVVGYNADSLYIIKSVDKKLGKAMLISAASPKTRDDAFVLRADLVHFDGEKLDEKLKRLFRKFDKRKVSVILNCEDDSKSLLFVKQLSRLIRELDLTSLPLTKDYGLQVFVFGSRENETVFMHYVEESKGLIRFINRHEQIAMNFVKNYPLTQFMTEEQIDYATATIREDVNLNVFMIGFGNFNETLFLTSVSNNQFLTLKKDGTLAPKPVTYHLYDRNYPDGKIAKEVDSVHSRSLNHGYRRYEEFLKLNGERQKDYLEFAPVPADVRPHPCDFSHPKFYASMREELLKKSYSYVIVSFGSDMENVEIAEKLQQKFHEWNIPSAVKIFVKVRDEKLARALKDDFESDMIRIFGSNRSCVYNADAILNEKIEFMARLRHLLYIAEDAQKKETSKSASLTEETLATRARDKWYSYKQFQRESNLYACLSLRMKLHLLGYDLAEKGEDRAEDFETKYETGDKRTPSALSVEGKTIWDYSNGEQWRNSVRWTYAVQEHQRWCANMICNGLIPSDREEIKRNGGRSLDKRLHGNITTMAGLVEYRKIVANAQGMSEEDADVIRYDYQLMDDVVWLLHACGYKLVAR